MTNPPVRARTTPRIPPNLPAYLSGRGLGLPKSHLAGVKAVKSTIAEWRNNPAPKVGPADTSGIAPATVSANTLQKKFGGASPVPRVVRGMQLGGLSQQEHLEKMNAVKARRAPGWMASSPKNSTPKAEIGNQTPQTARKAVANNQGAPRGMANPRSVRGGAQLGLAHHEHVEKIKKVKTSVPTDWKNVPGPRVAVGALTPKMPATANANKLKNPISGATTRGPKENTFGAPNASGGQAQRLPVRSVQQRKPAVTAFPRTVARPLPENVARTLPAKPMKRPPVSGAQPRKPVSAVVALSSAKPRFGPQLMSANARKLVSPVTHKAPRSGGPVITQAFVTPNRPQSSAPATVGNAPRPIASNLAGFSVRDTEFELDELMVELDQLMLELNALVAGAVPHTASQIAAKEMQTARHGLEKEKLDEISRVTAKINRLIQDFTAQEKILESETKPKISKDMFPASGALPEMEEGEFIGAEMMPEIPGNMFLESGAPPGMPEDMLLELETMPEIPGVMFTGSGTLPEMEDDEFIGAAMMPRIPDGMY